jgi:hypothetical protein
LSVSYVPQHFLQSINQSVTSSFQKLFLKITITIVLFTITNDTIIYKISCKDETIQDMYIGHTTNFENRMISHMNKSKTSLTKVYEFIRKHGGWDNWNMVILGEYTCKSRGQAARIEWFWWNKLGGTLNSVSPGMNYIRRDISSQNKLDSTLYINNIELMCRKLTLENQYIQTASPGLCRPLSSFT